MNRFRLAVTSFVVLLTAAAAHATSIVLPSDAQLVAKSPVIVEGTVVSSEPVLRDGAVWTDTIVRVSRALKGRVDETIAVHELGGELNGRFTKIFGSASFTPGEDVMLFLEPSPLGGYRTMDLFVGKFTAAKTLGGTPLWLRDDLAQDARLLDSEFETIQPKNVQRDAAGFREFVKARVAGRNASSDYTMSNPVLARDFDRIGGTRGITSNFTVISEPTIYRWSRFDSGQAASWSSNSTQAGYSGGGVSELQTAMAAWNNYGSAKIRYTYAGSRSTAGGLDHPDGVNEVLFNDTMNEIAGKWNPATGGVVGLGGFNGINGGGTWTAPFTADAAHRAGPVHAYEIVEGNLSIQDGVSPSTGISSNVLAEIISHELGHTLGFGHSADANALMYANVSGMGPSLRADDQLAARWLYPAGGTTQPPPPPPPSVPAAPSNLKVTVSGTTATLTWNDNASDETGQSVYLGIGGSFAKVGDVGANVQSVQLTGLTSGNFQIYVLAFNAAGNSAPSEVVTFTVALAPVALFSFTPESGNAGVTQFTFTDISTGPVTSRQWNFGDGATSTSAVVTHTFANAGQYNVTLTVSGNGATSQISRTVTVSGELAAAFTWSPSSPKSGENVQFTDQSGGAPSSWRWEFSDGTTSTQQNPIKKFASEGSYTAALTVQRGSLTSTATQVVTVSDSVPVTPVVTADFDLSPAAPTAGVKVTLSDRSRGVPTQWSWSFGDGQNSIAQNPVHTWATPGTYTVTLTATNATSSSVSSKQITVREEASYRTLVSVAAQTPGASNTSWRTELSLFNAGAEGASVTVVYLPASGASSRTQSLFLLPGQTTTYANALGDVFGITNGSGALSIEATSASSKADLRISSRTFTGGTNGTYGQSVPDVRSGDLTQTLFITGLQANGSFRTNVGLVNRSFDAATVSLTLYTASGGTIAVKSVPVAANSFQQMPLSALFPEIGSIPYDVLSVRLDAPEADVVTAYASVVDNLTQDPVYIQAMPERAGTELSIPVVGRSPGANGTFWRSDVTFFNPLDRRMVLSVVQGANAVPVVLEAHESHVLADVVSALGLTSGSGPLQVSWSSSSGPVVTSRTYTTVASGGTFGQSIDPVASFGSRVFVPGLRNDGGYRTNAGFFNGGAESETFTATVISPEGAVMGTQTMTLAPGALAQSSVAKLFPGVTFASGFTLQVSGDANAKLFAYGSMVDNASGDPVFFAGK